MIKILIIADDFTGALDTGVKLAAFGARTKVLTDTELNLTAETDTDVLVLCAPTRHVSPEEAYRVIRRITEQAVRAGVECIFKKTDSALRGNVGAELNKAFTAYTEEVRSGAFPVDAEHTYKIDPAEVEALEKALAEL